METPVQPERPRQKGRPSARWTLVSRLVSSSVATGELLGVLVHNIREVGLDGNYLDEPIPIGQIDEITLESLRLIRHERTTGAITLNPLGAYVTRRAILLPSSDGDIPRIDTEDLIRRLS